MCFLQEWMRLIFIGDSWLGRALRWGSILIGVGLATKLLERTELYVELPGLFTWHSTSVSLGVLLVVMISAPYIVFMAGLAWEKSRGPLLFLGEHLEADYRHKLFRLRVENHGAGVVRPTVSLLKAVNDKGQSLIESSTLPFELEWSHQPPNQRGEVSKHNSQTVGVIYLDYTGVGRSILVYQFAGMAYRPMIVNPVRSPLFLLVQASYPGAKPALRAFRIEIEEDPRNVDFPCRAYGEDIWEGVFR